MPNRRSIRISLEAGWVLQNYQENDTNRDEL